MQAVLQYRFGGGGLSAYALAERTADAAPDASGRSGGLSACLFAAARAAPQRTALRDSGDRTAWCGRPAITWTYAAAAEIVGRLARGIGAWRLPAGSRIGLWFSGGAESTLAHLAVEAAGHLPCPMPAAWDSERLSAAIDAHLETLPVTEDERILTLLPAHDLRGLVTGLGAALAAGAAFETVIPFDAAGFRAALLRPMPTRIVAPALIAPALAALPLPWTVRALNIVHRAPTTLTLTADSEPAGPQRLDSLVFDEDAVLTRPGLHDLAATLAYPERAPLPRALLAVARGGDGRLGYRGPACASAPLPHGEIPETDAQTWRSSDFRPVLSGSKATGIEIA